MSLENADPSANGYKVVRTHKDVTVSKLSALQKQVLVHARKAMLAKGQTIDPPTEVTICMRAPPWLSRALSDGLAAITKARKGYVLSDEDFGHVCLSALHPWMRPFAEMTFLSQRIRAHLCALALY